MKTFSFIFLFCVASLASSYSQTKTESIKNLFKLTQVDLTIDRAFSNIGPVVEAQVKNASKDSLANAAVLAKLEPIIRESKEMAKKMLDEDLVVLYDKYFTEKEINDCIRFYKTPTGQKMIRVMPDLQAEMMKIMMEKYMPTLQNKIISVVKPEVHN